MLQMKMNLVVTRSDFELIRVAVEHRLHHAMQTNVAVTACCIASPNMPMLMLSSVCLALGLLLIYS